MSVLPKDLIRDFIKEQNFTGTDSVLDLLKEIFKDVLQEALELELEKKQILNKATYVAINVNMDGSVNEETAINNLLDAKETWDKKYPCVIKSLNSQYRKVTKTKLIFPTDQSLQKILYLATMKITKKWTMRYRGWDLLLNQLHILFSDTLKNEGF